MSRLELAARGLPDSALAGLVGLAELATRRDADAATASASSTQHPEFTHIAQILGDVDYKPGMGWRVAPDGSWLQLVRVGRATDAGPSARVDLYGRKWRLSPHMAVGEVVQTALLAAVAFEEHEAREAFRWRGRAIFGPHITPSALHDASAHTEARHPSLQQEN